MTIIAVADRMGGAEVLGRSVRTEADMMQLIEQGIPKATIRYLAESLGIEPKELMQYLPVTPRNLQRYEDSDRLSDTVSDHIVALAELFEHGEDALGKAYFRDWLRGSIVALGNRRPVDFLKTHKGIGIIDRELGRIEHGIFA
ncbi:type II RES/Xre toxin-antitoxin system antitoxin [Spirosoma luteum]|uniref:type II RES/Xre toxin-antitoxin system antitoxin n=1 Tax=Spirosoma luteum TaxID=431553 RepID=UPI00035CE554|nr:antitoxin Xre-like helix-turn-helix domain-containing protein [Spirosoma luteum]